MSVVPTDTLATVPTVRRRLDAARPYVGILGVLIGSLLATLGNRVTTFGLADLRGALHAGFDEGAWITTSFGIGQILVGIACPYLGTMFGVRRMLFFGMGLFFTASALAPLSPNLDAYLAAQLMAGIGSGTFIPLTIGFIVRNLPARLVVYGLAAYAMNSEFAQNVGASLEGWYVETWSVAWLNWQYCVLLPAMAACVWFGVPPQPPNHQMLRRPDWAGVLYAAVGFGLLYAGLDQGNRLDWTGDGLVVGLLAAGGLVTALFVLHELYGTPRPFLDLRLMLRRDLLLLMLLLAGFRFIILSTAYIIPIYLQTVQNFRELQVGPVLLAIALPQFALVLPLAALLTRVDPRWVLGSGAALIAFACLQATALTSQWATWNFLPSQIVQAVGQSLALTALVVLVARRIRPSEAMTIGALMQMSRLFGGEIGVAFMQTFVRVREQLHSNLLGLHVDPLRGATTDRLGLYGGLLSGHATDGGAVTAGAQNLLQHGVAAQASVLAYIDGFAAAALGAFACLLLAVWLRPCGKT